MNSLEKEKILIVISLKLPNCRTTPLSPSLTMYIPDKKYIARIIADKKPALFFDEGGIELPDPNKSSIVFLKSLKTPSKLELFLFLPQGSLLPGSFHAIYIFSTIDNIPLVSVHQIYINLI